MISTADNLIPTIAATLGRQYDPKRYLYRLMRALEAKHLAPSGWLVVGHFKANGVAHSELAILAKARTVTPAARAAHHRANRIDPGPSRRKEPKCPAPAPSPSSRPSDSSSPQPAESRD